MAEKKTYVVQADGFIGGEHRKKNSKIELTDREAKYPELAGLVELFVEAKEEPKKQEPDPATLERKTR